MPAVVLITFAALWMWQLALIIQDIPRLWRMNRFYALILGIPDDALAACEFGDVTRRLTRLQEDHPISVDQLTPYHVANRIMRRENYLIALFNKEILELPSPFGRNGKQVLSKAMEWNLSFCILDYVFDESSSSVRRSFLKDTQKDKLAIDLQRRFKMIAIVNALLAPFILVFLLIYWFFRYAEEIYSHPSKAIGTRQYTIYARWKFREFNELPHQFERRLSNSTRKANRYMAQFHNNSLAGLSKFFAFVGSAMIAVLLIISIINEDLLMHSELTPGRSIIWWIGVLGALVAAARALTPDPSQASDPERLMTEVAEYTHYLPGHWIRRLHTERVHSEFGEYFEYRAWILLHELASVIYTPWALWNYLPNKASQLVDFFREFTVHVDGLGYVCSFALFDFVRHGNPKYGVHQNPPPGDIIQESENVRENTIFSIPSTVPDKYHRSKQGKMEKSFLSFVANNPEWKPDLAGSQYLDRLRAINGNTPVALQNRNGIEEEDEDAISEQKYNGQLDCQMYHSMKS